MIRIEERDNSTGKLSAKSTDAIFVNYKDLGREYLYMSDASANWDEDNPTENAGVVPPSSNIEFATDEEVRESIQAIIDSYEN